MTLEDVAMRSIGGFRARKGRKATRLGTPATAQVVGIEFKYVRRGHDSGGSGSHLQLRFALRVNAPKPFVAGVEATPEPPQHIRLGQTVNVSVWKRKAVLARDVGNGMQCRVPQVPCRAPKPGIDDRTMWGVWRWRRKGKPATITLTSSSLTRAQDLAATVTVRGAGFDDYTTQTEDAHRRFYASHLEAVGTALPGWARPARKRDFVIDWAAAAMERPGVNEPPAHRIAGQVPAESADAIYGVSFEQWATVLAQLEAAGVPFHRQDHQAFEHGVPHGYWQVVNQGWQQRVMQDPNLRAALDRLRTQR